MEFSCLKLDFQTLYRLQRQDFNISNTVNNEKRRKDIQEKGNKIFWTENANMKALIFVHLSSGSVSRKLGCRAFKYCRGNNIFGLLPLPLLHTEIQNGNDYYRQIQDDMFILQQFTFIKYLFTNHLVAEFFMFIYWLLSCEKCL